MSTAQTFSLDTPHRSTEASVHTSEDTYGNSDSQLSPNGPDQIATTDVPTANASTGSVGANTSTTSAGGSASAMSICNYYQKGNCLRINCRFFHGTEEQLAEFKKKNGVDSKENSTHTVGSAGNSHNSIDSTSSSNAQIGSGKKPIVCLSYLSGSCHRSDCRFVHLPPHVRPIPNGICSFYAEGICHRQYCRYFHGSEDQLKKLQQGGYSMYNPLTNDPYETVPNFVEEGPTARMQQQQAKQQTRTQPTLPPQAAAPPGYVPAVQQPPMMQMVQPHMQPQPQPQVQPAAPVVYLIQQPDGSVQQVTQMAPQQQMVPQATPQQQFVPAPQQQHPLAMPPQQPASGQFLPTQPQLPPQPQPQHMMMPQPQASYLQQQNSQFQQPPM